jgi:hypothetical protein
VEKSKLDSPPPPATDQPLPQQLKPCCGNCLNAIQSPKALGKMLCTALPPQALQLSPTHVQNVYPEMDAEKLGCTALWGVRFEMLQTIGLMARAALEQARLDAEVDAEG